MGSYSAVLAKPTPASGYFRKSLTFQSPNAEDLPHPSLFYPLAAVSNVQNHRVNDSRFIKPSSYYGQNFSGSDTLTPLNAMVKSRRDCHNRVSGSGGVYSGRIDLVLHLANPVSVAEKSTHGFQGILSWWANNDVPPPHQHYAQRKAPRMSAEWLALYLVTTTLKADSRGGLLDWSTIEVHAKAAVGRLELIVNELNVDEVTTLHALYYINRLFPKGAFVVGDYVPDILGWTFLLGRIFALGVLLAEKWLNDDPHHMVAFIDLFCAPPSLVKKIEIDALRVLAYDVAVPTSTWKEWLSQLQCACIVFEVSAGPGMGYMNTGVSAVINKYFRGASSDVCPNNQKQRTVDLSRGGWRWTS